MEKLISRGKKQIRLQLEDSLHQAVHALGVTKSKKKTQKVIIKSAKRIAELIAGQMKKELKKVKDGKEKKVKTLKAEKTKKVKKMKEPVLETA